MQKAKEKQQHIYQKGFITSKGRTPWKKFCVHCIFGVVLVILQWSLQTQLCPILPCHYEGGDLMQTRVSALLQISTIPHVQWINKWGLVWKCVLNPMTGHYLVLCGMTGPSAFSFSFDNCENSEYPLFIRWPGLAQWIHYQTVCFNKAI